MGDEQWGAGRGIQAHEADRWPVVADRSLVVDHASQGSATTTAECDGCLGDANERTRPGASRLFEIPGGWKDSTVDVGGVPLRLTIPADPDRVLDCARGRLDRQRICGRRELPDPYWAALWSAATPTAEAVLRADWPPGTTVLELGCGVGLVGSGGAGARLARHVLRLHAAGDQRRLGKRSAERVPAGTRPIARLARSAARLVRRDSGLGRPVQASAATTACSQTIDRLMAPDGLCWIGDPGRLVARKFFQAAADRFHVQLRDRDGHDVRCAARGRIPVARAAPPHLIDPVRQPISGSVLTAGRARRLPVVGQSRLSSRGGWRECPGDRSATDDGISPRHLRPSGPPTSGAARGRAAGRAARRRPPSRSGSCTDSETAASADPVGAGCALASPSGRAAANSAANELVPGTGAVSACSPTNSSTSNTFSAAASNRRRVESDSEPSRAVPTLRS